MVANTSEGCFELLTPVSLLVRQSPYVNKHLDIFLSKSRVVSSGFIENLKISLNCGNFRVQSTQKIHSAALLIKVHFFLDFFIIAREGWRQLVGLGCDLWTKINRWIFIGRLLLNVFQCNDSPVPC